MRSLSSGSSKEGSDDRKNPFRPVTDLLPTIPEPPTPTPAPLVPDAMPVPLVNLPPAPLVPLATAPLVTPTPALFRRELFYDMLLTSGTSRETIQSIEAAHLVMDPKAM